ncbi:hypothetical protein TIFTF001_033121 [Ficus carica]|uniref:Uncharacterized protein n=1 Tax=Ficus carica TaxID=3494 RepID=A0AA88J399_FICCA|nr:hypothetical protein TIFTF001_033121 [Ficus carica]
MMNWRPFFDVPGSSMNGSRAGGVLRQAMRRPKGIDRQWCLALPRPPRRLSTESFFRIANPPSILIEDDLALIMSRYVFPNKVQLRLPFPE